MIKELIGSMLATSALINIADAVNVGREEGFADIADQIKAYQWSAILDKVTCPRCRELDGAYFEADSPLVDLLRPPIHPACRCIYVAVLKEEQTPFVINFANFSPRQVQNFLVGKVL